MEIRPLTETERRYTYTQSQQLLGQTGCVGHLRGDFARDGNGFFTTWNDHRRLYKTDVFKSELNEVINALRSSEYGLLQNRTEMGKYAAQFPECYFEGNYTTEYGFRAETDTHAFLLRCNPTPGDYNFYCYCYKKEYLDNHIKSAEKGIRFVDSKYKELFHIADGDKIVLTDQAGEKTERTCRYIDEYHTEIGNHLYHICQFAELMERNQTTYAPLAAKEPKKETADSLIYHSDYGKDWEVQVDIQQYANNGRLGIMLLANEDGYSEEFGALTVNIDAPAPDYCGYLDTNNLSNVEKFVTENGLGEFTGLTGKSGFCDYPLYLFHAEKLRELCPSGMDAYEKAIGVTKKEEQKEQRREGR